MEAACPPERKRGQAALFVFVLQRYIPPIVGIVIRSVFKTK